MKNYTKVRFIGYAVPTTASGLIPIGDVAGKGSDGGYYSGNASNETDICARVGILANAVKLAVEKIGSSDDVLNVFVAPEFFFRGIHGPYMWSASEEDPFEFLQRKLGEALSCYRDWIFFCGSIITLESAKSIDELLNDPLYADKNNHVQAMCNKYLQLMASDDEAAASKQATKIRHYVKRSHDDADCQVKNRCVVINNINADAEALSTEKRFISNEDLVLYTSDSSPAITEQMSAYPKIDLSNRDVKESRNDPFSIFNCQYRSSSQDDRGITNVGIEICLDHSDNRLRKQLNANNAALRAEGLESVHFQIIPSCGMQIVAGAVVADTNGLVFNCDGELAISDRHGVASLLQNYNGNKNKIPYTSSTYPDGLYTYQAHSQLAKVIVPAGGDTPGTDDATFDDSLSQSVDMQSYAVTAPDEFEIYFGGGPGEIHVYGREKPIDLYP